jgi:hypothetical protein
VHKNCWGPGNLNLLGLGQPHLGWIYQQMEVLGDEARKDARFGPFGDSANLDAR